MKHFIYCRKSSEEDSRQTQSLGTQQRLLLDLASSLKLEVVDIIKESKSAKTDQNRPLFYNMLDRIKNGEADSILVVHTDRLARNLIDAGFVIKMIETGLLKEVRTLTTVFQDASSLFYMGFDFVLASQFSRDLSVKVKAGNESKLLKGEYPSYVPIGYINIQPGKGIEPDPIRAPFIKRAFELFSGGEHSVKTLAKKLASEGYRSRSGKKVGTSSLYRQLINPEYYGVINRKGQLHEGKHKPLISKDLFDKVQARFENKSRPKKQKLNFVFRDFLNCAECGCKVTAGIAKGKYIYYRCTNGKGKCSQHTTYWNKKHISDLFQDFFGGFTLDPERANKSFDLYKQSLLKEDANKKDNKDTIKQQVSGLKRKLTRLENIYIDEQISFDRYNERKIEFENELAQLSVLLKQKNNKGALETLELVEEIKNSAVQLSKVFEEGDDEVKRDLLKSVLWNCDFKDGKITNTRLTKLWKPLENLNDSHDLEKWRR
ncbi:MAG: recombinase family protein [Pseudomonadales bacterium]|nr:recombinase family protein [Pseudomonadales bacterium]